MICDKSHNTEFPAETSSSLLRSAHMSVWQDVPAEQFIEALELHESKFKNLLSQKQTPPPNPPSTSRSTGDKIFKVWTDIDLVSANLNAKNFCLVESKEEAEIIWSMYEFKQFELLKEGQFVNQFPMESNLTFKHMLPK